MNELKVEGDTIQFIVVKIGKEQFGIDIKFIDNIVRMQHITRVPKVADYLCGVINLRGEVIPVMSLRVKMNLSTDTISKDTRIIILKFEQQGAIGIIVDEVKEVITLDASQVDKVTYDTKDERINFLSGVGKTDNGLISILDLNVVVAEKENA